VATSGGIWPAAGACTRAITITEAELPKWTNVSAYVVKVLATLDGVTQQLSEHMRTRRGSWSVMPEKESLDAEYHALGRRLYLAILTILNRLIAYARSERGQYWLIEHRIDANLVPSFFAECKAQATVDGAQPFAFRPPGPMVITMNPGDDWRVIRSADWEAAATFVTSKRRPDLVSSILAGAEEHSSAGHHRAALTEAVTALEIAVSRFASSPNADLAFGATMAKRLATAALRTQVKHMGLTGSVRYLLPVVIPESALPSDVLQKCQEALTVRQAVVHDGQRQVESQWLGRALQAIRELCRILRTLSDSSADDSGP